MKFPNDNFEFRYPAYASSFATFRQPGRLLSHEVEVKSMNKREITSPESEWLLMSFSEELRFAPQISAYLKWLLATLNRVEPDSESRKWEVQHRSAQAA